MRARRTNYGIADADGIPVRDNPKRRRSYNAGGLGRSLVPLAEWVADRDQLGDLVHELVTDRRYGA